MYLDGWLPWNNFLPLIQCLTREQTGPNKGAYGAVCSLGNIQCRIIPREHTQSFIPVLWLCNYTCHGNYSWIFRWCLKWEGLSCFQAWYAWKRLFNPLQRYHIFLNTKCPKYNIYFKDNMCCKDDIEYTYEKFYKCTIGLEILKFTLIML